MCERCHRKGNEDPRQMDILKKIAPYLYIIRPKNLLITGCTQLLIVYLLFDKLPIHVLTGLHLYLFVFLAMLIAGAGFVINDIKDVDADLINKPTKSYIPHLMTTQNAWRYYWILVVIGFLIANVIAIQTDNMRLIFIYPLATFLLYMYSSKYQNSVLMGNLIVSSFVAFVPGIILVAERKLLCGIERVPQANAIIEILVFFMFFSFLVNLIREIIKDMEDMEGDQAIGGQNLALNYGKNIAIKWSILLTIFTLIALMLWLWWTPQPLDFRTMVYFVLLVACPLSLVVLILFNTKQKRDFSRVSTILKWTMLAGLGGCTLLANFIR